MTSKQARNNINRGKGIPHKHETLNKINEALDLLAVKENGCRGCWVLLSDMNYARCKLCNRNYGDMYVEVKE